VRLWETARRYSRHVRPYGPDSPWRLDPSISYLTHGTYGVTPEPVLAFQRAILDELERNPIAFLTRQHEARLDVARDAIAAFLGADPAGLVPVPNATTGVSTVLRSLRLRPGDELLTTDHEYNATLNALDLVAAEARARVVRVAVPFPIRHSAEVTEAILAGVTPRTRLAMISHVTSPTAVAFPIEDVVRELDRMGVDTLVDAAHAPGMVPLDLGALGAAYWTGNAHKWICAPKTSAMLVVRADRRHLIRPLVTSHGANDVRDARPPLWKLFDWLGTADLSSFLAIPEALRVMGGLHPDGWPGLMAENHAKVVAARQRLLEAIGGEPLVPESMLGAMAAVVVPGISTDAEALALATDLAEVDRIEAPLFGWPVPAARARITDPARFVLLRVSAQRYVDDVDLDRLIDALARRGLASATARAASGTLA
jgi:isopenicillin-N epimerase